MSPIWRGWGFLRRHPIWVSLAIVVVAVRLAMPHALRPVLEDQVSALLAGRIEIDDVDLSLLRGEVVLKGVRLLEPDDAEVVSFAALLANVSWSDLLRRNVVLEEIRLTSPVVRVVRDADGALNLTRLAAASESDAAVDVGPAPESGADPQLDEGAAWPLGLTRLTLEDAKITFSDRSIDNAEEIPFEIELLQVEHIAYGGPVYEDDGTVTLVAAIAGAPLRISAGFASEIVSATSSGTFGIHGLDVGLGSPYAAQLLGWTDLRGALDIEVDFAAAAGAAASPRIAIAVRDFLIAVAGEEDPALQWDALEITVEAADAQQRLATVSEVRLTNPRMRVRPADEQPLVLLARSAREEAADDSGTAADSDAAGADTAVADAATQDAGELPLRWHLGRLALENARIAVEGADAQRLDVGVDVELTGLSSEPGADARLVVKTAFADGTLDIDGTVTIAPISFAGRIDLANLSLPELLAVIPEPRGRVLRSGVARSGLKLAVKVKDEGEAPAVDASVSGSIGLAGLEVADDDPRRFSFKWEDLAIDIDGIDVRDGVPAADGGRAPLRIASVKLQGPALRGVRMEDGSFALPAELTAGADGGDGEAGAPGERPAADGDSGAAMPRVELGKLRVSGGSVRLVDRAVQPEGSPGLRTIALALDGVRLPERRIENLQFSAVGLRGGRIDARGAIADDATDIVLSVEKYRLVPYDPYATTFSGYGIRQGMLTVESKVRLQGDDFDSHTSVIVHQLGLKNTAADTEFERQIGVPITLALALLKDARGDIKLDVPVRGNRTATDVGIGGIVTQQLRRILVNALTSPLKLFGVGGGGDAVGNLSAARIPFAEGETALSETGRARATELGVLLRKHPDLAVHLDVRNSLSDVRAMQAKILLAELRAQAKLPDEFATIRDHLEARATGATADLPYHLEPVLDDMLSRQRPPQEEVDALSTSRITVVRELLTGELQVRPEQVLVDEHPGRAAVDGPAIVEAELGVVEEAATDED